jgi:hypothetical protein
MEAVGRLSRGEVAVIAACVVLGAMVVFAADDLLREAENRVVCGSNLKGLGTAQRVYANDYEDRYAQAGGRGQNRWAKTTPGWYDAARNWSGDDDVTVGASLYLLVREADVHPRSFVCPSSEQKVFDGSNPAWLDYVALWDFGSTDFQDTGPRNCVSYSYHLPYCRFPATDSLSGAFAVMADKSPWYESRIRKGRPSDVDWKKRVGYIVWNDALRGDRDWQLRVGNSMTHLREGQNMLFGDGHTSYEIRADVGMQRDNAFTPQGGAAPETPDYYRTGQMPQPYGIGYGEPASRYDSFLVNDDENNPCSTDQPGDVNGDCTVDMGDLAVVSEHWLESTKVEE